MDKYNIELIEEMVRKGIMSTVEISEILEREFDVKIAPHFISEHLFHERRIEDY